ncbi:hypothetical protein Bca52824_055581 [Brassica carinata]|uniref:Signal recognition particle subunit SRP68 n=1 Tax=Brassica carinata TaxID=52824 RepID=A0A8X7UQ54_BRACI|nr:hypothetical protein Bca52824_055581 [Brassica carinata]
MGKKENDMSAMEIDDPKSDGSDQILPRFSMNVLQLMKTSQAQHGLRRGDYSRYRRYCSARLRRLYKSLKFTHGRGKYTRRAILESTVTDVRFLHVVFYMAERAWSHAMEKRQLPDGPNARQRIYLIGRLRKAVKWATLFSSLCSVKTDSRTSLEAEVLFHLPLPLAPVLEFGNSSPLTPLTRKKAFSSPTNEEDKGRKHLGKASERGGKAGTHNKERSVDGDAKKGVTSSRGLEDGEIPLRSI